MDGLLSRLQRALAGRYAVEHELGRGGMAVVYLGHDLRLERRVAIKVFEKQSGFLSAGERFLREIRIAAQLQHPNILPVFESGDGEGLVYYIMPYVAGGSIRERLEREGPLPVADAVRIAREVAEALDHAHRAGIVHRDIKPDNIMLADGVAVVADFGIARAIEQSGGGVTDTGLAIGTPAYMSPEQASAGQVDGRTDIYALGCVLYEMLAGSPPFTGSTGQAVMARHATDAVPPLATVRKLPSGLEAVVGKALAKLPGDRWATGRSLSEALSGVVSLSVDHAGMPGVRRVGLVAAAILLTLVAVVLGRTLRPRTAPVAAAVPDSAPSVGILPFVMIGDSSQAHYATGLTEALITALVKVGGVRVPGQSTVARYEGRGQDPVAIGQELRVQNVVTATVQIAGPTLRVFPKITRVADGSIIWTEAMNGDMVDVFAMQDSIASRIIAALRVYLSPASRAILARGVGTTNQDAFNLYLLGRSHYVRGDPASLRRAVEFFKEASSRDSGFVGPLVGLLDAYDLIENVQPGQYRISGPGPAELLRRVLAIDSTSGEAYTHLALQLDRVCDSAGTDRAWQEALRFSPGSALIRREYSNRLFETGRRAEALAMSLEAARIDPTSPWVLGVLSHLYSTVGMNDSALAVGERALGLDSTQWVPHAVRGVALTGLRRFQEAIGSLETASRLGGASHGLTTASLGRAYALAGRREDALRVAQLLGARVGRGEAARTQVAMVYLALADRESAFQWLAKPPQPTDHKHRDNFWDNSFDPIRSDPRFAPLAARRWCASNN